MGSGVAAVRRHYAGDSLAALAGYRSALGIQRQLLGEGHREVALLHANIGDAQFALGQLTDSLASHTRALEILGKTVAEDLAELAFPLKGQALVRPCGASRPRASNAPRDV